MEEYLYIYHTKDEYELPIAVAGSIEELARMTGKKSGNIASALSKQKKGLYNSCYKKVSTKDIKNDCTTLTYITENLTLLGQVRPKRERRKMNREELKKYRIRAVRIRQIRKDIDYMEKEQQGQYTGQVKSSMRTFPYLQERQTAEVYEGAEDKEQRKKIKQKYKELQELLYQNYQVEQYIEKIKNELHKTIMEEYYMCEKKKRQQDIADELGMERSSISKIIKKYC